MIRGLHDHPDGPYLAEVEVSITRRCNLACAHCGFNVPDQPDPALGDDAVAEIAEGIQQLARLGIAIRSLAVLGGEPTLFPKLLGRALATFRGASNIARLEVVSNGLNPQGCTPELLRHVDRLSISLYTNDDALSTEWRRWLAVVAPHVELVFREQREGWAQWAGDATVSEAAAQSMYERCWYRKHCITIERRRLFVCSRIPKASCDDEGLPLTADTTFTQVEAYLNGAHALPSCRRCVPMMDLPRVAAGIQPDNRLVQLNRRAVAWLEQQ